MKLKKLTAIIASAAVMCFGGYPAVYAEDIDSENEASVSEEQAEVITSQDGLWSYSVLNDEEDNSEYASIVKYLGTDSEVSVPSEIDGNTVKCISEYAFMMNMNLNSSITKINIPSTITDFDDFSLFGCTALEEFTVDNKNEIYTVKDGVLFGDNEMLLVCYPPAKSDTEYTVPDGVVALNPSAFSMCKNLEKINLPDSLERIGEFCFSECTSLDNVVIPENVSELDFYTFGTCTSLTNIKLPDKMHTIGGGAFSQCTSLKNIVFPKYIQQIGQAAFASTGFTEIELPSTLQEIGYYAFGYTTDQQGQLVAMDSFTIKGVKGTMAQSYCAEEENEHITFEAIATEDDSDADDTNSDQSQAIGNEENNNHNNSNDNNQTDKEKGLKPGVVTAIIIVGLIVVIAAVMIIFKNVKKNRNENDDDEAENIDEENDDDINETEEKNQDEEQ